MGVWKRMLLNWTLIAADTQDLNVPVDHVKYLDINREALQNGTSAPSFANIQAVLAGYMQMHLGGINIVNMRLDDLQALNVKWMQRAFNSIQLGGGDNYHAGWLNAMRLPLFIDKMGPGGWRELSVRFPFVAATTNCDNDNMNVGYTYRDTSFAERRHLHYAYNTVAGVGAAETRLELSRIKAYLAGLLIFCTCDGLGAQADPEVSELEILVDDREVYHDNWKNRADERAPMHTLSDTDLGPVMNNYWWISFEEEPWLANKIWAVCHNTAFAGGTPQVGAFRLIPVYLER